VTLKVIIAVNSERSRKLYRALRQIHDRALARDTDSVPHAGPENIDPDQISIRVARLMFFFGRMERAVAVRGLLFALDYNTTRLTPALSPPL
jgi:hypothetical protein